MLLVSLLGRSWIVGFVVGIGLCVLAADVDACDVLLGVDFWSFVLSISSAGVFLGAGGCGDVDACAGTSVTAGVVAGVGVFVCGGVFVSGDVALLVCESCDVFCLSVCCFSVDACCDVLLGFVSVGFARDAGSLLSMCATVVPKDWSICCGSPHFPGARRCATSGGRGGAAFTLVWICEYGSNRILGWYCGSGVPMVLGGGGGCSVAAGGGYGGGGPGFGTGPGCAGCGTGPGCGLVGWTGGTWSCCCVVVLCSCCSCFGCGWSGCVVVLC